MNTSQAELNQFPPPNEGRLDELRNALLNGEPDDGALRDGAGDLVQLDWRVSEYVGGTCQRGVTMP